MNILKFGGTSMADHHSWNQVLDILIRYKNPVLVVSATSGTTNSLLKAAHAAKSGALDKALTLADTIEKRHIELLAAFISDGRFESPEKNENAVRHIESICEQLRRYLTGIHTLGELTGRSLDAIASFGERLSSFLIASCAQLRGIPAVFVDAAEIIKTDNRYTAAAPNLEAISYRSSALRTLIEDGKIPVMGGFYGSNEAGDITTLGRGGSDFTASLLGMALGADSILIWTDVSGMYTSDPRYVKGTRSIPEITFGEAAELAYFGAKVLHPATIQPAVERNIPVYVKNTFEPDHPGTAIRLETGNGSHIRAIAFKKDITVITVASSRMLLAHGFMAKVFAVFEQHEVSVDLVTTSEVTVSITVDTTSNLDVVVRDLQPLGRVEVRPAQALVSMVGRRLIDAKGIMAQAFTALKDIPVHMISQGSSDKNITIVVDNDDALTAVQALHDTFLL